VFQHQHTPEILQTLAAAGAAEVQLDFVPLSAPMTRGMMSISQLDIPAGLGEDDLRAMYQDYYRDFPLISVLPKGVSPEVVAVKNSARIEIGLDLSETRADGKQTLCVTTVLDNLIKGGAGQAMQNFNLMTGKDNNYQLNDLGMWP
jgi:N-acetyl-gamma-glutamyl-phosphate reductase